MVRFEVLTAVLLKYEAIWYMKPSWLVHNYWLSEDLTAYITRVCAV